MRTSPCCGWGMNAFFVVKYPILLFLCFFVGGKSIVVYLLARYAYWQTKWQQSHLFLFFLICLFWVCWSIMSHYVSKVLHFHRVTFRHFHPMMENRGHVGLHFLHVVWTTLECTKWFCLICFGGLVMVSSFFASCSILVVTWLVSSCEGVARQKTKRWTQSWRFPQGRGASDLAGGFNHGSSVNGWVFP